MILVRYYSCAEISTACVTYMLNKMDRRITFKRTRLAPTPSGYLHLGNILSFAITAVLARKYGARILLRIDDFDLERTNKLFVQDIFDTLNFLEIPWDEGPRNMKEYEQEFSQVHRMSMYRDALQQLRDEGHLFACSCSRVQVLSSGADKGYPGTCVDRQIPLDTPRTSWRIDTSKTTELAIKTLDGTVRKSLPESMKDCIVRRKDGVPAYQLISVIDDIHYGVDLVVRGEDLWASTLAQAYLARALRLDAFKQITFYHHPLVTDAEGKKLSKSEGATSVHYLRQDGKTREEIYSLIGEHFGAGVGVGSWEELAERVFKSEEKTLLNLSRHYNGIKAKYGAVLKRLADDDSA
jgi:glutamyl/glutaminyl-tRNA synthetase